MNTAPQLMVERISNTQAALNIAVVTETYPPDINGVAHTLSKIVQGLQARGHVIWLVRPRQPGVDVALVNSSYQELLVRGLPIPFYRQLRLGLPAKRELLRLWTRQRPDIVHIATEGPLGWSALQVARKLKLPISTDFRTNFHAYSQHYGIGWLRGAILAYMKKFHNAAHATMVPTTALEGELAGSGFKRLGDLRDRASLTWSAECLRQLDPKVLTPVIEGRWLDGYDFPSLLSGVRCPTLLLQADPSTGGALTDEDAATLQSLVSGCQHVRFPGCGHNLHRDRPKEVLQALQSFAAL